MVLKGNYSESIYYPHRTNWNPHSSSLSVTAAGWSLSHTIPGPDRRYNSEYEFIRGDQLQSYLTQISLGWNQYVDATSRLNVQGEFYGTVRGQFRVSFFVCKAGGHLTLEGPGVRLTTKSQVEDVIRFLRETALKAENVRISIWGK